MRQLRFDSATYGGYRTRLIEVAGAGPRLVLLHGFADSADTWSGVLAELAELGWSGVAVDLPGFGKADPLREGPVLPQLDQFVAALVTDQSRHGDVILVGNSLGALAAVRAAGLDVPLGGVVSIGQPALGQSRLIRAFMAKRTSPVVRLLAAPLPVPGLVQRWMAGQALRFILYADRRAADPVVTARFTEFLEVRGGYRWTVRQARLLALEAEDCYQLEAITCPLLVVHGRRDRIIPVNASEALHAGVPHSELVVAGAWGHCPQLDAPQAVARMVTRFADESLDTARRPGS